MEKQTGYPTPEAIEAADLETLVRWIETLDSVTYEDIYLKCLMLERHVQLTLEQVIEIQKDSARITQSWCIGMFILLLLSLLIG